jgi:hypothetical protein
MRGYCEGKPDIHARAVTFDRRIQKLFDFGKVDNLIEVSLNLIAGHSKDRSIQEDVFAAGQLRVKASADFEQASYSSLDADFPFGGISYST